MIRLILNRFALAIPVLLIMTALTFVLVSFIPGDAATTILGQDATPEKINALNTELGLDKPLYVQYVDWLAHAFRGDFGVSLYTGEAVTKVIGQRLMPTLFVAGFATLTAAIVGVVLGTIAAVRGGVLAKSLDVVSMLGISLPNFWFALLLVVIVAGQLGLFPALGYVRPEEDTGEWLTHLVLPVTALAVAGVAIVAKQARDSMVEALSRDFMRFMQANGIPRRRLILRHGLRYATVPIITATSSCFINLFGGTIALENVFGLPGLGSLVATSTLQHDLTAIQGAVLTYTAVILVITLLADVANSIFNPRVGTR